MGNRDQKFILLESFSKVKDLRFFKNCGKFYCILEFFLVVKKLFGLRNLGLKNNLMAHVAQR